VVVVVVVVVGQRSVVLVHSQASNQTLSLLVPNFQLVQIPTLTSANLPPADTLAEVAADLEMAVVLEKTMAPC
jgi:hypothetical protein